MSYHITDTGASIRFSNTDGFFFLMKHTIQSIQSVRDDLIKIEVAGGFTCLFIYSSQVITPTCNTAAELALTLNEWITQFMQPAPPEAFFANAL